MYYYWYLRTSTYEKICDKHNLRFIPLAFDTLGRMHPDSAKLLHYAFIKHRLESTKELLPSRNALWRWVGRAVRASCVHSGAACLPACVNRSVRMSRARAASI